MDPWWRDLLRSSYHICCDNTLHNLYTFLYIIAGVLPDAFCELEKGESVLLENTEETKSALFLLINKYILLKVNL